jgi:two-component system, OmpR family, response regulator
MPLITILVEDSEVIRAELIPAMTELAGAEIVAVADNAEEAIGILRAYGDRWQLAVVDLYLRSGSGLALLRACHERSAQQRIVVLTNYATPEIRRRCEEVGADALFDKSTEIEAFFDYCKSLASQGL